MPRERPPVTCALHKSHYGWARGGGQMEGILLDTVNLICLFKKKAKRKATRVSENDFGPRQLLGKDVQGTAGS